MIYSPLGIIYNTKLVKNPPKAFADLWRPEFKGQIVLPEITHSLREVAGALRGFLSEGNRESLRATLGSLSVLARSLGDPEGPTQRALAQLPGLLDDLGNGAQKLPPVLERLEGFTTGIWTRSPTVSFSMGTLMVE